MAGRLPYDAASLTDLARLQDTGPPPRLDDLEPDVPPALAMAVARALHRDPEHRYADAAEMEEALRDGLSGRAPAGGTDATWALPEDDTEATRMLTGTSATSALPRSQVRRRLEPMDEPTPPPRRAPRRASTPPPERSRRSPLKPLLVLLLSARARRRRRRRLPGGSTAPAAARSSCARTCAATWTTPSTTSAA